MIVHTVEIETTIAVEEVAAHVLQIGQERRLITADVTLDTLRTKGVQLPAGMWLTLGATTPRPGHTVDIDFGLMPTIWVTFRMYSGDAAVQKDEMVLIVTSLLRRVPGDCLFHYDLEKAWLLRRGGHLYVSDDDEFWTPERLAMAPPPYERVPLTFS